MFTSFQSFKDAISEGGVFDQMAEQDEYIKSPDLNTGGGGGDRGGEVLNGKVNGEVNEEADGKIVFSSDTASQYQYPSNASGNNLTSRPGSLVDLIEDDKDTSSDDDEDDPIFALVKGKKKAKNSNKKLPNDEEGDGSLNNLLAPRTNNNNQQQNWQTPLKATGRYSNTDEQSLAMINRAEMGEVSPILSPEEQHRGEVLLEWGKNVWGGLREKIKDGVGGAGGVSGAAFTISKIKDDIKTRFSTKGESDSQIDPETGAVKSKLTESERKRLQEITGGDGIYSSVVNALKSDFDCRKCGFCCLVKLACKYCTRNVMVVTFFVTFFYWVYSKLN